jgi:hypothetical protein
MQYRTGEHVRETDLGGPLTSSASGRVGNPGTGFAWIRTSDLTDTAGDSLDMWHNGVGDSEERARRTQLWANGQLVADLDIAGVDTVNLQMPRERTAWKLQRDVTMPVLCAAGTEAHTTWGFTTDLASAGSNPVTLPLLDLGYRVPSTPTTRRRPASR